MPSVLQSINKSREGKKCDHLLGGKSFPMRHIKERRRYNLLFFFYLSFGRLCHYKCIGVSLLMSEAVIYYFSLNTVHLDFQLWSPRSSYPVIEVSNTYTCNSKFFSMWGASWSLIFLACLVTLGLYHSTVSTGLEYPLFLMWQPSDLDHPA